MTVKRIEEERVSRENQSKWRINEWMQTMTLGAIDGDKK